MKKNVAKINESQLEKIVLESVRQLIREGFLGGDTYGDDIAQRANSPSEVFKLNNWTYQTVSKDNGELVIRCFTNNNLMNVREFPSFEKVVGDLNKYYQRVGSKTVAEPMADNSDRGMLLRLYKSVK